VALGHVHRHQVLCHHPPIAYAGSIERVDFSEEQEEKGYVLVELERGNTQLQFHPLPVRRFKTLKVDVSEAENPEAILLETIASHEIKDAVVRLIYQLHPSQLPEIEESRLHQALSIAHSYTIHPELVTQLSAPRIPELGEGQQVSPLEALRTYIANREDLWDMAEDLITAAEALMEADQPLDWNLEPQPFKVTEADGSYQVYAGEKQLRLL
jgi:exonuclease SbcD